MKFWMKKLLWGLLSFVVIGGVFYFITVGLLKWSPSSGITGIVGILLLIMISTLTKSKQQRNNELKHMSHVHDNHRPKNFW